MLKFFTIPDSDKILFTTPSQSRQFKDATFIEPDNVPPDCTGRPPIGDRVAIINGFSSAYGDFLNGCAALKVWRERFPNCKVTLFQLDPKKVASLSPDGVRTAMLPNIVEALRYHTCYYNFASLIEFETFNKLPMVDFFLTEMGIDPATVEPEKKRISYTPKKSVGFFRQLKAKKKSILLFNWESSSVLRTCPPQESHRLIAEILHCSDWLVISASPLPFFSHDRFVDVSFLSDTFDDYASIVSQVDFVVSVDSAAVHLADAFNKPTVGIFTTISPDLRTPYYPTVQTISLGISGHHKLGQVSKDEIQSIAGLWRQVSGRQIVELLGA